MDCFASSKWFLVVSIALVGLGLPAMVEAATPGFDPSVATDAYLATIDADARARSDAYFEGGYWIQLWDFLLGAVVSLVLLQRRVSAKMRDVAERISRRRPIRVFAYWIQYLGITTLVLLPWSYYTGFVREHAYELATQSAGAWFGDQAKGFTLGLIIGGLAITVLYDVFRRAPRTWWLWGATLSIVFLTLGLALSPVYIAPMFNDYTPLPDGPIRESILQMAHANGVDAQEVFMSDASAQSTRISANVSGILGTERITLNDNLLERGTPEEVEAVMGHELGHYVLNHVYESLLFFGVLAFGGFAFVRVGFAHLLERFGRRWGVRGIDDPAGLPILALLMSVFGFLSTPITNSYIRANEAEADIFGLNAAREPDAFATIALKLGEYRKLDPSPLEEALMFDHPSGRSRIEMAMRWKAAQRGADAEGASDRATAP